jgi:hypothetical protein
VLDAACLPRYWDNLLTLLPAATQADLCHDYNESEFIAAR